MRAFAHKSFQLLMLLSLIPPFSVASLMAQQHVVPHKDLHDRIRASQRKRMQDLRQVQAFFSSKDVRKALEDSALETEQIRQAVPFLSDAELARLSSQTEKIQRDISAGALDNQQLTYIVIALATAVVVILAT